MRDRSLRLGAVLLLAVSVLGLGCDQLDGRNRNRQGGRLFHDGLYSDSVGQYEKALKEVDDPVIHYNAGLAYQKEFKAGMGDKPILLAKANEEPCKLIPAVKQVEAKQCVKENDRHYTDCGDKDACTLGYTCEKDTFCALDAKTIANAAADHMQKWIKVQASDEDLKKAVKEVQAEIAELTAKMEKLAGAADSKDNKAEIASIEDRIKDLEKRVDELHTKDRIRGLMTQMWDDSDQYDKALGYWSEMLKEKPNDPGIMGVLAGINLKAGDWRKSIEWYNKVAGVATDTAAKVAAYQFIGNVAWSKLNSKTLSASDSVELADRGIGALQKAAALQPDSAKPIGLQASIYNFRGQAQGASWAGGLDRASAQDLQHTSRVLMDKAKKAAGTAPPAPGGAANNPNPPVKTGG